MNIFCVFLFAARLLFADCRRHHSVLCRENYSSVRQDVCEFHAPFARSLVCELLPALHTRFASVTTSASLPPTFGSDRDFARHSARRATRRFEINQQTDMASVLSPPLVPTPPRKTRPRSQTLTNAGTHGASAVAGRSPGARSSYQQPVGTGSLRRQIEHESGHGRSRSHGDMSSAAATSREEIGKGKRRAVFCDVVLDEIDLDDRSSECVYPPSEAPSLPSASNAMLLRSADPRFARQSQDLSSIRSARRSVCPTRTVPNNHRCGQ